MAWRRRWILGGITAVVLLLFAGQWTADFLADRWWAGALVPEAASFNSGIRLLRLTLNATAVLVATAWYTGHLLVVHRAIDSVQISRQVANLEIREAVTPSTLLPLALGIGVALGLVAGLGSGREWPVFALAWHGVAYNLNDPFLHRDLGVFVAQLPLWTLVHGFARFLAWSSLLVTVILYTALGAVRWQRGRAAISDHARRHLGLLFSAVALVLAWGFVLDPFLAAAGRVPIPSEWNALELSTLGLAGASLAAAGISALWALRGQHLLMVAGWGVLLSGMLLSRLVLPGATPPDAVDGDASRAPLDQVAYGLNGLEEVEAKPTSAPMPDLPSLWTWSSIGRMVTSDSMALEAAGLAAIPVGGSLEPVWLALRSSPGGSPALLAISDRRTGVAAGPLSFRAGDSLGYPGVVTYTTFSQAASRPGAARLHVDMGPVGLALGGFGRRIVLAWSLQSGDLLRAHPESARVRWHLSPRVRLERLAPFASWESPRPVVVDGRLMWVAHGYLASAYFPGSTRMEQADREIGTLEAGIIGTVDAVSGATALYLAPDAGPLSRAWADIAQGMVRPPAELPVGIRKAVQYPVHLFDVQSRVVEQPPWRAGQLPGGAGTAPSGVGAATSVWEGGKGFALVAPYLRGEEPRVRTLLVGRATAAGNRLTLLRLSEGGSLPGPTAAQATWDRFPSYEQILDSVTRQGQRFERGPYRILPWGDSPIAYQAWYALDPNGRVSQPYLALAQGGQVGAGRGFGEAWGNLRGMGAPPPPGFGPLAPLEEARRWMLRADSALRAGDWEGFGRAFGALGQALGIVPEAS